MIISKKRPHPYKIVNYKGNKIRIDKGILSLLTKMWKLGIVTTNSCQSFCSFSCNHKRKIIKNKKYGKYSKIITTRNCRNNIWIVFNSIKDLEKFYNYVAEYYPVDNKMYSNMHCDLAFFHNKKSKDLDSWSMVCSMDNDGVYGHTEKSMCWGKKSLMFVEDGCKKNKFVVRPQLTIPHKHLAYVEARLQLALDKKSK